jgi:hypothetical protein
MQESFGGISGFFKVGCSVDRKNSFWKAELFRSQTNRSQCDEKEKPFTLTPDDLREIEGALSKNTVQGA